MVSPLSDGTVSYTNSLKRFFTQTRYVREGDLVAVAYNPTWEADPTHLQHYTSTGDLVVEMDQLVFFKVHKVEPKDGCWVDPGVSKVAQVGKVVVDHLPHRASLEHALLHKAPKPVANQSVFDRIQALLVPMLEHSPALAHAKVLLHGKAGTGKRLMVRQLGHRFGLDVREVSMAALRGLPEAQIASRLKEMLGQKDPHILHL